MKKKYYRKGQYRPAHGIPADVHTNIIESWYDQQDVWTKDKIDAIGDSLNKGVKDKAPGRKTYFGLKSQRELCWALARFLEERSY